MQTRLSWNQNVFDAILRQYLQVCSRDAVTTVNTKGFYIARAATRLTLKAGKEKIEAGLGKIVSVEKTSKKGTLYYRKGLELTKGTTHPEAPLAGLIINARMGRHNKPGLQGRAMKWAIRHLIGARKRSNAFIASGWIDAIKTLEPLADRGRRPQMASTTEMKRYGTAKGEAIPAVLGANVIVKIVNNAIAKRDKKDAIGHYGGAGLIAAFESEANSMLEYLERKMSRSTAAANRQLGP